MRRPFTLSNFGLGIFLIALGIAYISDMNFKTDNFALVFRFYPLLPILLGVDYLLNGFTRTSGIIDRPTGWVTTFIILLTIAGLIFSIVPRTLESHFSDMREFQFTRNWWSDFGHRTVRTTHKELSLPSGITTVRIENEFGKMELDNGDTKNIDVTAEIQSRGPLTRRINAEQNAIDLTGKVEGERYIIRVQKPDELRQRHLPRIIVNLSIKLPKGLSVEVVSKAGDVEVGEIDGNLDLNVSAGKIRVEKVGKNLTARNDLGSLEVEEIGGNANVESSLGEVQLLDCSGAVHAKVSSGRLKVNLKNIVEPCDFDVSMGSVEIGVPRSAKFTLDAQTSMGSIESRFPVPVVRDAADAKAKGDVNGGGPLVRIKASTGSIQLQEL